MARAIIKGRFASAADTAAVLGVSRVNTEKLIKMAERTLSSYRTGRKAKNGASTVTKKARKRR
jgi:hypothetical protein